MEQIKRYGFGIDLGGTTCKIGLFSAEGDLLDKWAIPTDTSDGGSRILKNIAESLDQKLMEKKIPKTAVFGAGIGVPGAVTDDGIVNRCVNLGWGVFPIEEEFSALTGLYIAAGNDANVAALGENFRGSGRGCESIVMVTLGTGIGGGIVLHNRILTGHNGAAGEIGHIVVNPQETETCGCGNHGCIEQYASATGIARLARRYLKEHPNEATVLRDDPRLSAKTVFDAAKKDDDAANAVVNEVCSLLGHMLAVVANVVNPEAIVIGGGVSKAGDILIDRLMPSFHRDLFHACKNTKVVLASLGNDAGIYGGARLVLPDEEM